MEEKSIGDIANYTKIYPNPITEQTLLTTSMPGKLKLSIYIIQGQLVADDDIAALQLVDIGKKLINKDNYVVEVTNGIIKDCIKISK